MGTRELSKRVTILPKRGRREYWKFLTRTLVFHRAAFSEAMNLAITGFHWRPIVDSI